MARSATIGLRIEPDLKAAAEKAAQDDRRSLASLVELALVEYLKQRGYLKDERQ